MALIVVLSVYNGIGELTQNMFNIFDPELKIEPAQGKSLHLDAIGYDSITRIDGIERAMPIVEENAWLTYEEHGAIVTLRGVTDEYGQATGLDSSLIVGSYCLRDEALSNVIAEEGVLPMAPIDGVVLGSEIYYNLGIKQLSNTPIAIHIPRRANGIGMSMDEAFNNAYAMPMGAFMVQQEIDNRYAVADIELVRHLLDYDDDECTCIAITLDKGANVTAMKTQLRQLLGADYSVKDRMDQQPLYYKIFRSERLGIILILALIVMISTLSLAASLSLLIIDKKHDIATLRSMGATKRQLRRLFFTEGEMICFIGIIVGLLLGFMICFIQQQYGIIKMGNNFIVDAFPVSMRGVDFVITLAVVGLISTLSVWLSTRRSFE